MVNYKLINVGKGNYCGEVEARTDHPEHVEAVVLREAKNHLGSKDVYLSGDNYEGLIMAGVRPVGRYERCGT